MVCIHPSFWLVCTSFQFSCGDFAYCFMVDIKRRLCAATDVAGGNTRLSGKVSRRNALQNFGQIYSATFKNFHSP